MNASTHATAVIGAVTTVVLTLAGCQSAHADSTPTTSQTASAGAAARSMLNALAVRVPDTGAHYRRSDWGGWTGLGGCNTRERVLIRDAGPGTVRRGPGCRVLAGTWRSPYDTTRITNPSGVQIDHRVPVKEANQSGARGWSSAQRARFYNDPTNLVAVSAHANTSKGDRDPGTWRPTNRAAWCGYAAGYITTKHAYRLTIDPAERAGLVAMLNTCPGGGGR